MEENAQEAARKERRKQRGKNEESNTNINSNIKTFPIKIKILLAYLEKILYLWALGVSRGRRYTKTTLDVSVVLIRLSML